MSLTSPLIRTFQTRLRLDAHEEVESALTETARVFGAAQRALHAESGKSGKTGQGLQSFKKEFCARFGLAARMFNALAFDLRGKIDGVRQKALHDLEHLTPKIEAQRAKVETLEARLAAPAIPHGVLRRSPEQIRGALEKAHKRLAKLLRQERRARGQSDAERPAICFGSRGLFAAQNHLAENGYASHAEWLADWRRARAAQFLVVGSDDETGGNQTCRGRIEADGSVSLRLLAVSGPVDLPGLRLPHGHQEWVEAIRAADAEARRGRAWQGETARLCRGLAKHEALALRRERAKTRRGQEKGGRAITYRFVRDGVSWRLFVTLTQRVAVRFADLGRGCVAVDLNEDHAAAVRLGPDGAIQGVRTWPLHLRGLSTGQREARLEEAAARIVDWAEKHGLPLVLEALDFAAKKRWLRDLPPGMSRRLSSFAYRGFDRAVRACAKRRGVAVFAVDPGWTSVLGAATVAVDRGLGVHHAAAVVIGRRALERAALCTVRGENEETEIARALLGKARAIQTSCEAVPAATRVPGGHLTPVAVVLPVALQRRLPGGRREALAWIGGAWRAALAARRQGAASPPRSRGGQSAPREQAVVPGAIPGAAPTAVRRGGDPQRCNQHLRTRV